MTKIDIIVPVRNEEANLAELVNRIIRTGKKTQLDFNIILVIDPSTDNTEAQARLLGEKYPLKIHLKQGKPGKAHSIIEGAELATSDILVMIDGDLQYAPESIPDLLAAFSDRVGVVIGERKIQQTGKVRKLVSKINRTLTGRILTGLDCDTQSGLKLFRRDILDHLDKRLVSDWSIDVPLLLTAKGLGYQIWQVPIIFTERAHGKSKVNFWTTTWQIVIGAIKTRLCIAKIFHLKTDGIQMLNAGVVASKKRFITHTTLNHKESAIETFYPWQKLAVFALIILLGLGIFLRPLGTAITLTAVLTLIYFCDVFFNLFLVIKSLRNPPEIKFSDREITALKDSDLPVYSILCPLYKEWQVLPQFTEAINNLDWPKNKLDVLLLLEEDDQKTLEEAITLKLPNWFRLVIVPDSQPKTKPKACNYGLSRTRGEYVVIYDAEDKPDPDQLKKAFAAFQKVPKNIFCLQAKLNYYNPSQNILTRLFTAEYSLWFDIILPGLQSINTAIPLGGTSNHFRTQNLIALEGWDPFNVTEDCDLGVRLFKKGYQTAIIDSTTLEEANSKFGNWLRQRSRWIKGYIQTYLVHMRNPFELIRAQGIGGLTFQLVVGGKIAFMFINPLLWLLTLSYFVLYKYVGSTIESFYPAIIFYMAVFSLVVGNFLYLYYYMIGVAKRGDWALVKYVYLTPIYWLMVSVAAVIAGVQLITKPHYWEKTVHGFHLKFNAPTASVTQNKARIWLPQNLRLNYAWLNLAKTTLARGGILVLASAGSDSLNFFYNSFLSRKLTIEEFGLVGLVGSFVALSQILLTAISRTVTYKSAFLVGKYAQPIRDFWAVTRRSALKISFVVAGVWIAATPLLMRFFNTTTPWPFLLFTPVWIMGLAGAIDEGFLTGNLWFVVLATMLVVEAVVKISTAVILVYLGLAQFVYLSVATGMFASFCVGYVVASRTRKPTVTIDKGSALDFPQKFFWTSLLTKLSGLSFLSLDLILVKHFLSAAVTGEYVILSLTGKIIFFLGAAFGQFVTPLVSRDEGAGRNSKKTFSRLLISVIAVSLVGYAVFGLAGRWSATLLFGPKANSIVGYLPIYLLAMVNFSIGQTIVSYHQIRKHYLFPTATAFFSLGQIGALVLFHQNLGQVSAVMLIAGSSYLFSIGLLHYFYSPLASLRNNLSDFLGLFGKVSPRWENISLNPHLRILIFNWRDTKHVWSGGAEIYLHELAKRWVKMGNEVTIFCSNDGKSFEFETQDGVNIVRRGGFYTVYVWAFVYYILRFRGKYDVVIDSENGIPFFTPLYVGVPVLGLIYHINQEVFNEGLIWPFSRIAQFVEAFLMPVVYKNRQLVTVSNSSKNDILSHGFKEKSRIEIVHPGINLKDYKPGVKTANPTILYLGRLRPWKSVETIIQAMKIILEKVPQTQFVIAGEGDSRDYLEKLTETLGLGASVKFTGRIAEKLKPRLYAQAWVSVQPSKREGWGMTVIESNASGTPVVASNVVGLKDSISNPHTGYLVPCGNPEAFAQSILNILTDTKLRQEFERDARAWAKNFSWDASADKFLDIIYSNIK